jgi:hypothetical protein
MKTILSVIVLAVAGVMASGPTRLVAAEEDGIALAIVYDTSGSMRDGVRDADGHLSPKFVIANRALMAITRQIQAYATNNAAGTPLKVQTGLFIFDHGKAKEVVKFGPFDADALKNFAGTFSSPDGGTPLGRAVVAASHTVLDSPLPRKHVLVITDGMNTVGPEPAEVLPKLNQQAEQKQSSLSVHFIAFDVNAKVFDSIKKLGATVVGAADEKQLNTQLDFIMQKEILLEKEEPAKKK